MGGGPQGGPHGGPHGGAQGGAKAENFALRQAGASAHHLAARVGAGGEEGSAKAAAGEETDPLLPAEVEAGAAQEARLLVLVVLWAL